MIHITVDIDWTAPYNLIWRWSRKFRRRYRFECACCQKSTHIDKKGVRYWHEPTKDNNLDGLCPTCRVKVDVDETSRRERELVRRCDDLELMASPAKAADTFQRRYPQQ